MRNVFRFSLVLATLLAVASPSSALEKHSRSVSGDGRADWGAGATFTIQYYNICTGWVWVLSGFSPGDRVGTAFEVGPWTPAALESNFMFFVSAAPPGYGFTGTVSVYAADANECPSGPALASQALLPVSFWNLASWGGVWLPGEFVVEYEFASDQGLPNPLAIGTDHPAAGPTGPQACGACYPTTRTNHSYYYGTEASPLCPGSVLFNDGICDAQLLFDAAMVFVDIIVPESWAKVKDLYR